MKGPSFQVPASRFDEMHSGRNTKENHFMSSFRVLVRVITAISMLGPRVPPLLPRKYFLRGTVGVSSLKRKKST